MKKLLTIFILCILLVQTAFAVPADLWNADERVENLYNSGFSEKQELDILQKLLGYAGIIDKDALAHDENTTKSLFLTSFGRILGLWAEDEAVIEADMRRGGYIRKEDKLSGITFDTGLYAALRATGYCEEYFTAEGCQLIGGKEGFLYNLSYEKGKVMTQREFVQLLYNTVSANVLTPAYYAEGGGTYLKHEGKSLLESVWGITIRRGIVTAVYGESIYSENTCEWGDIYISDEYHKYNPTESVDGLVGRECIYFIDDNNTVLFAEATENNRITELKPYSDFEFKSDRVEYYKDGKKKTVRLSDDVKVIYNGVFAGQYSTAVVSKYISDDVHITFVDSDGSSGVDVMFIRRYYSYPVEEYGAEGVIRFKYDLTFKGKNYINALPDDEETHVDIFMNGVRVNFNEAKIGAIVSIADSINESGHNYTKIILDYDTVSTVLSGIYESDAYELDGEKYRVSPLLLDAQKSYAPITVPKAGNEYTFIVDVNGTVSDISYVKETAWGYLVRIGMTTGLDEKGIIKIFTEDAKMVTYTTNDKPVLHDKDNRTGRVLSVETFCTAVKGIKEDYRTVVQFKLNKEGELTELWLPITNNDIETDGPGTIDYKVTKDYTYSGNVGMYYYNGVVQYLYMFPSTAPCFCVPTSFDAEDIMYQVKQPSAWGNTNTPICELYSLDEFGVVGAGLVYDDGNDYTINTNLTVVEKVICGLNAGGDTTAIIYGWQNGSKVKLIVMDDSSLSEVFGDYEGESVYNLKFGDIIQANMLGSEVVGFRVIYKVSAPPVGGGIWRYNGAERTNLEGHSRFEAAVGTLKSKKGSSFVAEFEVSGKIRPVCFYTDSSFSCYVIDTEHKTVTKAASPEMNMYLGTEIVIQKNWSQANNVFLYK